MKLVSPCFSDKAKGTLAKTLTYQTRKYANTVQAYLKKKDANTIIQSVYRSDYSRCVDEWGILGNEWKLKFRSLGREYRVSGFNLFMMWWFAELFKSRYGVGKRGLTKYNTRRPTPKINPFYMEFIRQRIFEV